MHLGQIDTRHARPLKRPLAQTKYEAITTTQLDSLPQLDLLTQEDRTLMKAVASVLPFRTNRYIIDELIDWAAVPNDPIFQLTFPQPGMLSQANLETMAALIQSDADSATIKMAADAIRRELNPHPAGQIELNVPEHDSGPIEGLQHKYRQTTLFFPAAGQTCHAYCTYCFRWAQFVGLDDLKFAARDAERLTSYLREHREVTSVLFTGGDPMVMKTKVLRRYIEPIIQDPALDHIESIRIGTKAPAYWPQRFVTDADADDLLRLIGETRRANKHLAIMAHYSHPRELSTPIAQKAMLRLQDAGAVVRSQAPLIKHVNDSATTWAEMWQHQVRLGIVPYYMFVERDTGPKNYFEVPLGQAHRIFTKAYREQSGLGRTVRGPSMSATPGKVLVDGVTTIGGEKVFALKFIQARNPLWVGRPFFAKFSPKATWLDDLTPAFGDSKFFFE